MPHVTQANIAASGGAKDIGMTTCNGSWGLSIIWFFSINVFHIVSKNRVNCGQDSVII